MNMSQNEYAPSDDVVITLLNSRSLMVVSLNKLILEGSDGLDALFLESLETSVESFLLRQQGLHTRKIASVVF